MSDMTANENSQILKDLRAGNNDAAKRRLVYDPKLKKFVEKDIDPLEILVPFEIIDPVWYSGDL